jgi:hypothetical protein
MWRVIIIVTDETPENILTFPELVGQLLIQCAIFESLKK